jgi:hypothetical protein
MGIKNIFKKVAKIPPGELQERSSVVKQSDETEIISGQWWETASVCSGAREFASRSDRSDPVQLRPTGSHRSKSEPRTLLQRDGQANLTRSDLIRVNPTSSEFSLILFLKNDLSSYVGAD